MMRQIEIAEGNAAEDRGWLVDAHEPLVVWTSRGIGYGVIAYVAPRCPPPIRSREYENLKQRAILISAAPELAAACKDQMARLRSLFDAYVRHTYPSPSGADSDLDLILADGREALKKAGL